MKVVVVRRQRTIAPFGRGVDACALGAGTFADARASALAACGLPSAVEGGIDDEVEGPALVWSDDVWVTRRALAGFLKAARAHTTPVRLALPPSRMLDLFLPLQDVDVHEGRAAFEVAMVPAGGRATPRALFALGSRAWAAPPYREIALDLPVPRYILRTAGPTMQWPLTSTVAMRIRHWVHVLRAGHLAPQVALLDHASASPVSSALRVLASMRLTKRARLAAYRRAFVFKGRDVTVHPTATVEASVLGDGVTIGAHALVQNSVLGVGSVVEQRAHLSGCALGPRTFVSLNSSLSACVSFGDTDTCINGAQACVFAERGGFTSFSHPLDLAVEGAVRVDDEGQLRDVGELPCGVAFGPEVFVGANVLIAAGRAIPAGVRLYSDSRHVLQRIPVELGPGRYAVVDGKPQSP